MIVFILNAILVFAFIIATLWTIWGTYRLTQQIKRLSEDSHTNKKDQ